MSLDTAQLRKNCVYRTDAPVAQILVDLAGIEKLVQSERAFRRSLRWAALGCLALGLALAFLLPSMALTGILAAFALFIYSFVSGRHLLKNINRMLFLREVVTVLQQDTSRKASCHVNLAFRAPEIMVSEMPWTARKKGKQQLFTSEWLSLEGRLLDGTYFSQTVTDLIRKRTYSNANNKRKTKTRTRVLIALKLEYPSEVFGDARVVYQSLRNAIKVPPNAKLKGVKVTEKALSMKALVNSKGDLKRSNLMLFLGAYRVLNLSRQLAAKGRQ